MRTQIGFLSKYLTVEKPCDRPKINQKNPIWEYQKLAHHDKPKCHINRITAQSKHTGRHKLVRMVCINTNPKTPAK